MTSIYQRALGQDFDRLHPKMQERFGFSSHDGVGHIGIGTMDKMTRGTALSIPFLLVGTTRNLLFPEHGEGVPFTIANYAYGDRFGRETVTWNRTFHFLKRRRFFDATMIYSGSRRSIVDYLGTHQHVAADLACWVDDEGGINFASGDQRWYERGLRFRIPRLLTGHATVREWWDDGAQHYRIQVNVTNPILGHIIGYQGSFTVEVVPVRTSADIPPEAKPMREVEQE